MAQWVDERSPNDARNGMFDAMKTKVQRDDGRWRTQGGSGAAQFRGDNELGDGVRISSVLLTSCFNVAQHLLQTVISVYFCLLSREGNRRTRGLSGWIAPREDFSGSIGVNFGKISWHFQ